MKIFITGSRGYLAGYLRNRFLTEDFIENVLMLGRSDNADIRFDLLQPEEIDYQMFTAEDIVVHTAAISGPDQCAKEYEECKRVNVDGTIIFLKNVIKQGSKVVFFSSDAVFGSNPSSIYTEESPLLADTAYGKMKKTVEEAFSDEHSFKALRLPYIVSAKDKFTSYCISCIKNDEAADIFHPFYRSCVTATDLTNVVLWMIRHFEEFTPQVLNIAGNELVSRLRIADELNRILNGRLRYSVSIPDNGFFLNRPKISQMKSLYLDMYGIIKSGSFTEKFSEEMKGITI